MNWNVKTSCGAWALPPTMIFQLRLINSFAPCHRIKKVQANKIEEAKEELAKRVAAGRTEL